MIGAVDIGGTKIAAGVVDDHGRLLARRQAPVEREGSRGKCLQGIARMLTDAAQEAGVSLEGIGIACTGQLEQPAGRLKPNAFLPDWGGAYPAVELGRLCGLPAAVENDADAAALGEAAWGAGAGARRFIMVTLGTGIGGGIVLDGQLYRGVDGSHPEIGHHVIDPSGPECFCGARGCWEVMASGTAVRRWARAAGLTGLDAQAVCALAREGNPAARKVMARVGEYLGLGLANLVTLFAPEVIALGGSLAQAWDLLEAPARAVVERSCRLVPRDRVQILPAALGPDASLIGAAEVWRRGT